MKEILILGAGKSASVLIEYLIEEAPYNDWHIHVADANPDVAASKTGGRERASAYGIDLENTDQLNQLVEGADLVISMLPPFLHTMVARSCLQHKKHFINASYITPEISDMHGEAKAGGMSFLCEMGLDPGIDHMSAMEMIHSIRSEGGKIKGFRSHCGGLISPESDDNPWHYKISWNPRNIVMAGKDGAAYLDNGMDRHTSYQELYDPQRLVHVPGMGPYAWYPNRDSLAYMEKYEIKEISTFVRTTLRHPDFCRGWKKVVELRLTDERQQYDTTGMGIRNFVTAHLHHQQIPDISEKSLEPAVAQQFKFLGLFSDELINRGKCSSADVLQWLVENRLGLKPGDKDMIIMLHEISYTLGDQEKTKNSHLVVKGQDNIHTAMAKTVGLPLALAAKHILNGNIRRRGVFIPVHEDVYNLILPELEREGIVFSK